jgi:hypothetical protein
LCFPNRLRMLSGWWWRLVSLLLSTLIVLFEEAQDVVWMMMETSLTLAQLLLCFPKRLIISMLDYLINCFLIKCLRHPSENNLCGYYVCEHIYGQSISERNAWEPLEVCKHHTQSIYYHCVHIYALFIYSYFLFHLKVQWKKKHILPTKQPKAFQEQLAELNIFYDEKLCPSLQH